MVYIGDDIERPSARTILGNMESDVCVKVGGKIRELRIAKGISQTILSQRCDLTQANLSRIESGKAEPGLRMLYDIAKALGVKLAKLVADVD